MCAEEDKEVKQAFDEHAEKVNKFLERAPFHYVRTLWIKAGYTAYEPVCTLCGNKRSAWYCVITDKDMEFCYIGSCCWHYVVDKIILNG